MKRIQLLIASSIFIASTSTAQISKGSVLLGGGISAFREKSEGANSSVGKATGVFLSPSIGFATNDNKVFGIKAGYGGNKSKSTPASYEVENKSFNAGFFYRRYLSLGASFYLFGEGGVSYGKSKYEQKNPFSASVTDRNSNITLSLFPGVTYAVSKRFHLEASINNLLTVAYNKNEREDPSSGSVVSESKRFDIGLNASNSSPVALGFRVVLGK